MSMHCFTIEGFSDQEIMDKLRREHTNYRDAMKLGTKEISVPRFLGFGRRKKYVVSFVISDKQKAVDSAVSTIHEKSRKLSEERLARRPLVSDMAQVRRTVSIIESGRYPAGLLPRPSLERTQARPSAGREAEVFAAPEPPIARPVGQEILQPPVERLVPPVRAARPHDSVEEAAGTFGQKLRDEDVDPELVELILNEMKIDTVNVPFAPAGRRTEGFQAAVSRLVRFRPGLRLAENEKKIVIVAGPTGVGKTTTLVKLSAESYRQQIPLRFVTNDTYRIGATGQLESYANIMAVPLDIVSGCEEANRRIAEAGERLILMDTAGRSPRDDGRQAELRQFLSGLERRDFGVETFLVLSMNTDRRDLEETVASFAFLNPSGVVMTKTDESGHRGKLLNFLYKTGLPAAYFTTGQSVPEDIIPATAAALAGMVLN